MWTVNTNYMYKNILSPEIFLKAAFQRVCEKFVRGFQSDSTFSSVSKGFQSVSKPFKRVSKGFQSISKGFPKGFKAFQKGFQSVSEVFPNGFKSVSKGFKPSETGFQKGFRVTSNPLKNAFVDKTCFRMDGHIFVQQCQKQVTKLDHSIDKNGYSVL